jgi:hypothetical protein
MHIFLQFVLENKFMHIIYEDFILCCTGDYPNCSIINSIMGTISRGRNFFLLRLIVRCGVVLSSLLNIAFFFHIPVFTFPFTFLYSHFLSHSCIHISFHVPALPFPFTFLYSHFLSHSCILISFHVPVFPFPFTFLYSHFLACSCIHICFHIPVFPFTFLYSCFLSRSCIHISFHVPVFTFPFTFLYSQQVFSKGQPFTCSCWDK